MRSAQNCVHVRAALILWSTYTEKPKLIAVPPACDEKLWQQAINLATKRKDAGGDGRYFDDVVATTLLDVVRYARKHNQPVVVPGKPNSQMRYCGLMFCADNADKPKGFSVQAIGVHWYGKFERVVVKLINNKLRCPCPNTKTSDELCVVLF